MHIKIYPENKPHYKIILLNNKYKNKEPKNLNKKYRLKII